MCPKCHGRLTAISERTGGFSGTKAVVGAVVAGPVGVAAGALGKKLVIDSPGGRGVRRTI